MLALRRTLAPGALLWTAVLAVILATNDWSTDVIALDAGDDSSVAAVSSGLARQGLWSGFCLALMPMIVIRAAAAVGRWRSKGEVDWLGSRAAGRLTIATSATCGVVLGAWFLVLAWWTLVATRTPRVDGSFQLVGSVPAPGAVWVDGEHTRRWSVELPPSVREVQSAVREVQSAAREVQSAAGEVELAAGEVRSAAGSAASEIQSSASKVRPAAGEVQSSTGEVPPNTSDARSVARDAPSAAREMRPNTGEIHSDALSVPSAALEARSNVREEPSGASDVPSASAAREHAPTARDAPSSARDVPANAHERTPTARLGGARVRVELGLGAGAGPATEVLLRARSPGETTTARTHIGTRGAIEVVLPAAAGAVELELSVSDPDARVLVLSDAAQVWVPVASASAADRAIVLRLCIASCAWIALAFGFGAWISAASAALCVIALWIAAWLADAPCAWIPGIDLPEALAIAAQGRVPPELDPRAYAGAFIALACGLALAASGLARWRRET